MDSLPAEASGKPSQVVLEVKKLPANAEDTGGMGLIPGLGRSSGEGNSKPLQDSCLENPMDRGVWRSTVHGTAMSRTGLSTHWSHMRLENI